MSHTPCTHGITEQNYMKKHLYSKNLIKYLIWKGTCPFFLMKQTTSAQLNLPRSLMLNGEGQFQSLHLSVLLNAIPSENITHPQLQGKQPFTKFL